MAGRAVLARSADARDSGLGGVVPRRSSPGRPPSRCACPATTSPGGSARALGYPITSTSANRSGQPPTCMPGEVAAALGGELDGLVDAGPCPGGLPSTIVDVTGPAPRLVRAGAVPWERVLESMTVTDIRWQLSPAPPSNEPRWSGSCLGRSSRDTAERSLDELAGLVSAAGGVDRPADPSGT